MEIIELKIPEGVQSRSRLDKRNKTLFQLLSELRKKDIPDDMIEFINREIEKLNAFSGESKKRIKLIKKTQTKIIQVMAKELKIVPKNHYMLLWMAIGMSVFGIPIGIALGAGADNMALIGTGIPIGMTIGLAIGAAMDNKAKEEGRQLNVKIEA